MSEWPEYYILIDRLPVAVDMMTWARWCQDHDRSIARDEIGNAVVSTVFLGLNHNMRMSGEPILFETMIFGGPLDQAQWRHRSYDEAERYHRQAVIEARKAHARIKSIADQAGL
jgi:hypothetical protein